ncbi:uncharacterized protein LOC141555238 isoform X3 [Sminthopsis crassicaudata]|uniref:uncharacterized protein LOC141555238 isoform X3 n=1 Tax=Sminthopsis crassicaudata TaxID=9301 RepID=UPI003D68818D
MKKFGRATMRVQVWRSKKTIKDSTLQLRQTSNFVISTGSSHPVTMKILYLVFLMLFVISYAGTGSQLWEQGSCDSILRNTSSNQSHSSGRYSGPIIMRTHIMVFMMLFVIFSNAGTSYGGFDNFICAMRGGSCEKETCVFPLIKLGNCLKKKGYCCLYIPMLFKYKNSELKV